jgi:ubiquinone/menaquinone biosynthesis C-methylase UbiE
MMKNRVKIAVNNPIWDLILRNLLLQRIKQELTTDDRLSVLEIGCGRGGTTNTLLKIMPNAFITASDIDDNQIKLAEKFVASDRVEFLVEHGADLSFDDRTFDLVTEFNTLHHISAWQKTIEESSRVIKPGGRFILSGITKKGLGNTIFKKFVAPKSMVDISDVILEAQNNDFKLINDFSNPYYMRLIFRKYQPKPTTEIINMN